MPLSTPVSPLVMAGSIIDPGHILSPGGAVLVGLSKLVAIIVASAAGFPGGTVLRHVLLLSQVTTHY